MGDDRALTRSERVRSLAAIIAAIAVFGVTVGLSYPLLSLILEERGTDSTLIGLNAASTALALVLFSPFIPRLIRRVGLAPMMLACIAVDALTLLLLPVVDNVWAWFPLRFVMGLAATGLFIGTEAWINQIAEETSRGRVFGLYASVLAAGFAAGPVLLTLTGTTGWPPFVAGAAIVAIGGVPLLWVGRLAPRPPPHGSFGMLGFVRAAPTMAAAVLLFGMLEGGSFALLAPYGVRSGLTAEAAALMLTVVGVGAIVLQIPIGWLADRTDRYRVLLLCGVAALIGVLLLPAVVAVPLALAAALFVWGGLAAGLYTVSLAIAGQRFRGGALVTANAAFGALYGLGSILGPGLGGVGMDLWDPHGLPLALALSCLAFLVLAAWRGRRDRAPLTAPTDQEA